jgi:hypothetical protein
MFLFVKTIVHYFMTLWFAGFIRSRKDGKVEDSDDSDDDDSEKAMTTPTAVKQPPTQVSARTSQQPKHQDIFAVANPLYRYHGFSSLI